MADREKVINALERCVNGCDDQCPYEYGGAVTLEYCRGDLMRDALELLKEQEPIGRCKDCRYWQDNDPAHTYECRWCHDETPDPDDYCSFFEWAVIKNE